MSFYKQARYHYKREGRAMDAVLESGPLYKVLNVKAIIDNERRLYYGNQESSITVSSFYGETRKSPQDELEGFNC